MMAWCSITPHSQNIQHRPGTVDDFLFTLKCIQRKVTQVQVFIKRIIFQCKKPEILLCHIRITTFLLSVNNAALWRILPLYLLCRSSNARRFVTFLSFIIKTNNIGCGLIYAVSVLLRSVICSNDWSFGVLLYMN